MAASGGGMRRSSFIAWIVVTGCVVAAQSLAHLVMVLGAGRIGTEVDLDRSNGLPDLMSTVALASAAAGAGFIALEVRGRHRVIPAALAGALAILTLADLVHDGAHASSRSDGWAVLAFALAAVLLLAAVGLASGRRARGTVAAAGCLLAMSFLVDALDWFPWWIAGPRGDPAREYQIVLKEGFELFGWSLVALALWDEALRRRYGTYRAVTTPASRALAASRRRVA